MHPFHAPRLHVGSALTVVSLAALSMLSACGGSDTAVATATSASSTTLGGTVAVGAPITNGRLRVLDANGTAVASDVAIDADGRYAGVELSGPAPYRIEACGYAGPNYLCVYSVAAAAGTANVTPLTTATVLLASGAAPDTLMSGSAPTLTTDTVAEAQTQLRTGLADVLAAAGVSPTLDFMTAALDAGSRTGYDRVLDSVGVKLGQDDHPFVQITPRLGQGNLYLEQGNSVGSVTTTGTSGLQLGGLETLFVHMSEALASDGACRSEGSGIARSLASNVRMSLGDGEPATGVAQVADGLCGFFGTGESGNTPMWGARMLSPTLGRCDLSGTDPVCGVSFVLQSPEGDVIPVGNGMGVTQQAGVWKFMGDLLPISIRASAKAQRTQRIDTIEPNVEYNRALAFEVAAVNGLACAKVSQRLVDGTPSAIAFYKRHPGATDQARLSLWTPDGFSWGASLDPLTGATRSADDTWLALPEGNAGDAVIRNFYRGGRSVNVALYSDASCSVPFEVGGVSAFDVDVEGVPPVWASMATLPWPELADATRTALRTLSIDGGATGSFAAAWSFARGPIGINGATVCGSRANCGQGGAGRLGEADLRASARSATLSLHNIGSGVGADDEKTLALYGRNGEGVDLQSNYSSCPSSAADQACH